MAFVIDASVAGAWAFAEESSPLAEKVEAVLQSEPAVVPGIWWYETRNLLVINERSKRISKEQSESFLALIAQLPIQVDSTFDETPLLDLARHYGLSFYDASYLELALRRGLPIATLDRALETAAMAAGVPLLT
jgi:predicted nucleic acid-binding protein